MADETTEAEAPDGAEAQGGQPDYKALYEQAKAHSREWERKAKANRGAAEELEQLKSAQMSDLERAQREAEGYKAKLARLEAEREREAAAARVSEETGAPLAALRLDLSTEDGMRELARLWADGHRVPSAPATSAPGSFDAAAGAPAGPQASFSRFMTEHFRK